MLAGCGASPWSRTGNQGGSTPLTLLSKLASGDIASLNPDDIQVLTDTVRDITQVQIDEVSDDLAAAVIDTITANGISTIQDLERVGKQAEQNPNSLKIPDSVTANRAEIETIFQQLSSPETRAALQQQLQGLAQQFGVI
jgi:hypothetical protein